MIPSIKGQVIAQPGHAVAGGTSMDMSLEIAPPGAAILWLAVPSMGM